jgi:2-polyprenyl-3-methyl-5-hydroxy-6-metoxy-1,4-benzoquinol methylase
MFKYINLGSEQYINERGFIKRNVRRVVGHPGLGHAVKLWNLERFLSKHVSGKPKTILDFGCADGSYAFYLKKKIPTASVFGIDGFENGIHSANKVVNSTKLENTTFTQCEFGDYLPDKKHDLAICLDAIYYSAEGLSYLSKILESLNDTGYLIFSCPKLIEYYGSGFGYYTGWVDVEEHDKLYCYENVKQKIELAGFDVLDYIEYPPKLSLKLIRDQKKQRLYIKICWPVLVLVMWINQFIKCGGDKQTHYMLIAKKCC